ncbi:MAG: NAD(P)-binding protein [Candidatus Omnitrophica bacterium]|nr:NAD(P)-binding protein [Candidatus Omnitrophota bacterium]
MSGPIYDFCVVGAGPSGLTVSYQLLKAGYSVLLIERDDRIGGLAKSYNYDGHVFDTGPKRFHTDDPVVLDFIQEITQGDIAKIGRSTKVYFLGKYFEWPLQSQDLLTMPVGIALRCLMDLIKDRKITDAVSFHQYINSRYGETLYAAFFRPYTHKFLRWDVEDIHSDWATTGINRTVIDDRIKSNTLFDLLKGLLLPQKIHTEFLYPNQGGFGGFYERLLEKCLSFGQFRLMLGDSIAGLEKKDRGFSAITKTIKSVEFNDLIWTGNLNDLSLLIQSDRTMHYLNTIFYNIVCRKEGIGTKKAQWIYVSRGDSLISRITCMGEFAGYTCPDGYYNVMCELTDSQTKPIYFKNASKYTGEILNELIEMKFLRNKNCVEGVHLNPVVDTYPIYHRRYISDFSLALAAVKKFSPRIHLLGRSGAFWYNNSDHSIRFAIEMAQKLIGKQEKEFDFRHYFGGLAGRAGHPQGE